MDSQSAVPICSPLQANDSFLLSKSNRLDWSHQNRPECMQQRLNDFLLAQGQGSFRPSFSISSLLPWTICTPRLTLDSEGKPLRRLLIDSIECARSKK